MIDFSSNMKEIIDQKLQELKTLKENPDPILKTVAKTIASEVIKRVHQDGKDSDGNQIGTYSAGYMKVRTGNYKNSGRISRGANKGKLKDSGKYTKGLDLKISGTVVEDTSKGGLARPRYNRTPDTKVILSLTRQMENDLSVCKTDPIDTPNGYGIGYLNHFNYEKALWCEATYKKPILTKLTDQEEELAIKVAQENTNDYLKSN